MQTPAYYSNEDLVEDLQGRVEQLEGALQDTLQLLWHPDRVHPLEAWGARIEVFREEKDMPPCPVFGDEPAREEWQDAFQTWFNDRLRKAYRVLEERE